jgi:hypothetical protein
MASMHAASAQQAARGLSGANVTVLNGTGGLGDLTAGGVSQGDR